MSSPRLQTALLVFRARLFAVVVPATVVVYVPSALAGSSATSPIARGVGLVIAGAGLILTAWCWVQFISRGRGTPAPWDPPRFLVLGGPYRYVGNPIYIGIVAILLGEAAFFQSVVLLMWTLLVAVSFHLAVIAFEEPGLRNRFGEEYERYVAEVPRWLPRRRRPL